jgi:hypothetical protein
MREKTLLFTYQKDYFPFGAFTRRVKNDFPLTSAFSAPLCDAQKRASRRGAEAAEWELGTATELFLTDHCKY